MKFAYRLCLIATMLVNISFAARVPQNKAEKLARNFWAEKSRSSDAFTLKQIGTDNSHFYTFTIEGKNGFIIVSSDDVVYPVLGYSFQSNFSIDNPPPGFQDLMNHYKAEIDAARNRITKPDSRVKEMWDKYTSSTFTPAKSIEAVLPMLATTWDQGCNYNDSCPQDPNSWACNRTYTGCVATAVAQIMKYYNFPASGTGNHSYQHASYGLLHANFGATNYNWSNMPNNLNSGNMEVARLMYHVGVGVEMDYGPSGSGAPSANAAMALIHFFNYSTTTRLVYKVDYTPSDWNTLIKSEIDAGRPVYYSGYNPQEGHAFVADGYQNGNPNNIFFHFNWGWSGSQNGYFQLSNLDPGGSTFNNYQEAIIGITPGIPAACSGASTLTGLTGDFTDGSYTADYQNNASCDWLIQPSNNPAFISLQFLNFNTQLNNDQVKVYDGSTSAAPLLGTFSGSSIPPALNSTGNTVLVEFNSDGATTAPGWSAHYRTHYCFPTSTLTTPNGTVSDGSGTFQYLNETDCYWLIDQPGNTHIALLFNSFETEDGYDFVSVYDGADVNAPLLGSFSGANIPNTLFSTGNKMLIHFNADAGVVASGWDATYTTSVGMDELNGSLQLFTFPNPAHDRVTIQWPENSTSDIKVVLYDISGKKIKTADFPPNSNHLEMDLGNIQPGYYLLSASNYELSGRKSLIIK